MVSGSNLYIRPRVANSPIVADAVNIAFDNGAPDGPLSKLPVWRL